VVARRIADRASGGCPIDGGVRLILRFGTEEHRGNATMKCLSIVAALAAVLVSAPGAHSEPAKIRISWVAVPNNLPPLFMSKPEMMKHAGTNYTVDPIRFPGTPQSVAALASGDLDIAL